MLEGLYCDAPEKAGVVSQPGASRLFKKKLKPPGHFPVNAGVSNAVLAGVATVCHGGEPA